MQVYGIKVKELYSSFFLCLFVFNFLYKIQKMTENGQFQFYEKDCIFSYEIEEFNKGRWYIMVTVAKQEIKE